MDDPLSAVASRQMDCSLTVVTRRTYRIEPGRALVVADEQLPLVRDVTVDPDTGHLLEDLDVFVHKHRTDVVVLGQAYAPEGHSLPRLEAKVAVGEHEKRALVIGNRQCRYAGGHLHFSEPEPFETMPLDYRLAYGGSDESAREQLRDLLCAGMEAIGRGDPQLNRCVYPRNPIGLGYAVQHSESLDGRHLPNFEDPDERLTPDNLVAKDANHWYRQPVPTGFGWYSYDWFPRSAHLGFALGAEQREDLPKPGEPPIREVRMGWLPSDIFAPRPLEDLVSDRVASGASPGLALPHLEGDEPVTLVHLDPKYPELSFQLPGEKPRLFVTPLDEERRELEPVVLSVIIHKEQNLLSMVWGGRTTTYLPYGAEQDRRVPFEVRWG